MWYFQVFGLLNIDAIEAAVNSRSYGFLLLKIIFYYMFFVW